MNNVVKEKTSIPIVGMPLEEPPRNQELVPQAQGIPRKARHPPMRVPDDENPRFVDLLGRKPVLADESSREFVDYRRRIYEELDPRGPIEEMFVNSLITAYWDFLRLTSHKIDFMNANSKEALGRILTALIDEETKIYLLKGFSERNPVIIEQLKELLKSFQVNLGEISAKALAENISVVQKIELLIAIKEASWIKALKELEARRELLARRFRAFHGIKEEHHYRGKPKIHPPAFS